MRTAIRSAAERLDVGCPEPAEVLARTESTLSCWASSKTRKRSLSGPSVVTWAAVTERLLSVAGQRAVVDAAGRRPADARRPARVAVSRCPQWDRHATSGPKGRRILF